MLTMNKCTKLLVLVSSLILAGCRGGRGSSTSLITSESSADPKTETTVSPTSESTTGQTSITTASSISSSVSSSSIETNTFTTSVAGVERTHIVTTSGSYFTEKFKSGVQIVNNIGEYKDSSEFITYFNADAQDPLLWKIAGINVMANETGEGENKLKIGSKSAGQDGQLKLLFNYQVKEIKVEALPYYKYDSYNKVYNVDTTTSLSIDGEKTSFECEAGVAPSPKTITKSYSTTVNEIILSTDECDGSNGQRTFINSIQITYIA